jgi:undecaprenyl-diphosphatase
VTEITLIQIIVLAVIQGLTEFLPVSSSAHLILGSKVFGWPDQGLVFDVATHLGTLLAVFAYFRRDLLEILQAWIRPAVTTEGRRHRVMGVYLALASIPALFVGLLAHDAVELYLRDVRVIAWTTIGFGLLLWVVDARCSRLLTLDSLTLRGALLIGAAQALALIPGVSRSGVTITAGRFLGLTAEAAARFSFLLAIPIIGAAGSYGALRVMNGDANIDWFQFVLALLFSALAGWVCIAAFLALLKRLGLVPFVVYRLALGLALLWIIH